jgi:hypothetical protein
MDAKSKVDWLIKLMIHVASAQDGQPPSVYRGMRYMNINMNIEFPSRQDCATM